jgi:DNA-binding response OmpR family regulator
MNKLLLIDDDKEVLTINTKHFRQLNYEVNYATNANSALKKLESFTPDCIVIDVMMPGIDGFKACPKIKEICQAPIMFLTGRDSEDDKIKGLLLGADDYMVKPYSLRELEVRIQVLIRRYKAISSSNAMHAGLLDFPLLTIENDKRKVTYKQTSKKGEILPIELSLTNKEYDLLYMLASSPNKVFTFEDIGNAIWGGYMESDRKTIMVTASRLRKKLDLYQGLSKYVETVWAQGYKFIGEPLQ